VSPKRDFYFPDSSSAITDDPSLIMLHPKRTQTGYRFLSAVFSLRSLSAGFPKKAFGETAKEPKKVEQ